MKRHNFATFDEYLKEQMKDPEFKKAYDDLEPEYDIIESLITSRKYRHLTQHELAEITGINQASISRIENGTGNPSIGTLKKLAKGLDMKLKISLVPIKE